MKGKLLALSALVVLPTAFLTVAGTGIAGASPAMGSVTCSITGSGTFSPGLTLPGSNPQVKITFTATGTCTGSATTVNSAGMTVPVAITSVNVKGTGYLNSLSTGVFADSCLGIQSTDTIGMIKVKDVWTATPAISNTVVNYTGGTAPIVSTYVSTPLKDKIKLPAPSGTTFVTTGSFSPAVLPMANLKTNILNACSSTWGPYPTFTIKPGSFISLP
jgi:hypothetical protein